MTGNARKNAVDVTNSGGFGRNIAANISKVSACRGKTKVGPSRKHHNDNKKV